MFSKKKFLVGYLSQNIDKIYFTEISKIEDLKDVFLKKNNKFLEISSIEGQNLFYNPNFNLEDILIIKTKNIS